MKIKGSWKTSLGGLITSAGATMLGAAAFDWMEPETKKTIMMFGFIFTVGGPLIHGLFSRDESVSDQAAGIRPEVMDHVKLDMPKKEEKEEKK